MVRALDPRIQTFFWSAYLRARQGEASASNLVAGLDEAASLVGCLPDEAWVLRVIYCCGACRDNPALLDGLLWVAKPEPKMASTATALGAALPGVNVPEVLAVLAAPGVIHVDSVVDGEEVWAVAALGRVLLKDHQNEDMPTAAAALFLQYGVRNGTLVPWEQRNRPEAQARRRRRRKDGSR
jgi:hypothetical protein